VAAFLALVAAIAFALAAALQQRGQFALARRGNAVEGLGGLVRLLAVPIWLAGTVVLLLGYGLQGAALDRGKLIVVQPLLVTTIVWALPLGYWLTAQHVARRQVLGAGVVVIGLALFVLVGDPDAGVANASTESLLLAILVVSAVVAVLLLLSRGKASAAARAAVLGVCAGLYFGLSAGFAKPVLHDLPVSVGEAAGDWWTWALLGSGFVGFLLQQLSLATGQLAPAMAAVSASKPAVSVLLGITLANRETEMPDGATAA
jgi:drug/metabolite transporter (DMT)-like permease